MDNKKFNILNVSSKFAICGLPLRGDTYKTCTFGCKYCFSNNRKIMEFDKHLQIGNISQLEKTLIRIFDKKQIKDDNLLDVLVNMGITWHIGGMSDPFQPCEKIYGITKKMVELGNKYGISMVFSTKSDTYYDVPLNPKLHSIQMSFSGIDTKLIEPNVPSFEKRYAFYKKLKKDGFRVGIRIQPFIPNITTLDLIEKFKDADHFTIEGIKLVPQNKDSVSEILSLTHLNKNNFTQMGLLNLKYDIRIKAYQEFINKLEEYKLSYSIADNDLHHLGNNNCCCGDKLINKSTTFNNTYMEHNYNNYSLKDVLYECGICCECKAKNLFTSNRQEGCITVKDFYEKRFDRKSSPFSPKFLNKNIINKTKQEGKNENI